MCQISNTAAAWSDSNSKSTTFGIDKDIVFVKSKGGINGNEADLSHLLELVQGAPHWLAGRDNEGHITNASRGL